MAKKLFVLLFVVLLPVFVSCSISKEDWEEFWGPGPVTFERHFGVRPPFNNEERAIIQPLVTKKLAELEAACAEAEKQVAEAKAKKTQPQSLLSSSVTPDEVKKQLVDLEKVKQVEIQGLRDKERTLSQLKDRLKRAKVWALRYQFKVETKPESVVPAEKK